MNAYAVQNKENIFLHILRNLILDFLSLLIKYTVHSDLTLYCPQIFLYNNKVDDNFCVLQIQLI